MFGAEKLHVKTDNDGNEIDESRCTGRGWVFLVIRYK
jgi:hypothetical protein